MLCLYILFDNHLKFYLNVQLNEYFDATHNFTKEHIMQKITNFIWLAAFAVVGFFGGEELYARTHQEDSTPQPLILAETATPQEPTVWDKTKGVASDVWDGTKEVTSDVWDGTKKVGSDVWAGTKEVGSDIKNGIKGDDSPEADCTKN